MGVRKTANTHCQSKNPLRGIAQGVFHEGWWATVWHTRCAVLRETRDRQLHRTVFTNILCIFAPAPPGPVCRPVRRTCDFCCACGPKRPTVLEVRAAPRALKHSRSTVTWAIGGYRRQGPCLRAEGGALGPDGPCENTALILANREEDEE